MRPPGQMPRMRSPRKDEATRRDPRDVATDKRRTWTPSWKGVIITVLLGANIILIRIIEALVYKMSSCGIQEAALKELCLNRTYVSRGCRPLCPDDWIQRGDDCYYYSDDTNTASWDKSRDHCRTMGADLLVIKTQEQKEFINRTLSRLVDNAYWTGLRGDGSAWRWVDGEQYNSSL
ncbi:hypothetical protein GDO81_020159 [Engystomops pustulosus]|uniref:C-type lectin domain-containing protein n=1 Tax=Engystomops pustulosus TaxID=76066 RepID=A0AAV6Z8N3_ENGPU|nr:hypothetical protein GDO81_020159 [Engystomops pustulosus]